LGGDPERLALSALQASRLGAQGIDLNFGCPAPTVNRHDGGASLLKYPERIFAIIKTVRQAAPSSISVSAKFRLGWDSHDPIYKNAEMAVLGGANWITIHGRTKIDGYKPPAYWGPIGELSRTLPIPVVANGDIWTLDDFKKCRDQTGCEHYMLGRGAVANPHLPLDLSFALGLTQTENPGAVPTPSQWKKYYQKLVSLSLVYSAHEPYALSRVKQWAKSAHLRVPSPLYDQVKTLKTLQELYTVIHAV